MKPVKQETEEGNRRAAPRRVPQNFAATARRRQTPCRRTTMARQRLFGSSGIVVKPFQASGVSQCRRIQPQITVKHNQSIIKNKRAEGTEATTTMPQYNRRQIEATQPKSTTHRRTQQWHCWNQQSTIDGCQPSVPFCINNSTA